MQNVKEFSVPLHVCLKYHHKAGYGEREEKEEEDFEKIQWW